jgi:hypothetical protein
VISDYLSFEAVSGSTEDIWPPKKCVNFMFPEPVLTYLSLRGSVVLARESAVFRAHTPIHLVQKPDHLQAE